MDLPHSLVCKLRQVTLAARQVLACLALACPRLHQLHVDCLDAPNAIPDHHFRQLHTLALGTHKVIPCFFIALHPCSSDHLQPLLACLSSLTILPLHALAYRLPPAVSIAQCTSLTYLDLGSTTLTTKVWESLPARAALPVYHIFHTQTRPSSQSSALRAHGLHLLWTGSLST